MWRSFGGGIQLTLIPKEHLQRIVCQWRDHGVVGTRGQPEATIRMPGMLRSGRTGRFGFVIFSLLRGYHGRVVRQCLLKLRGRQRRKT